MAASVVGLGLLLGGARAAGPVPAPVAPTTYHFVKEAGETWAPVPATPFPKTSTPAAPATSTPRTASAPKAPPVTLPAAQDRQWPPAEFAVKQASHATPAPHVASAPAVRAPAPRSPKWTLSKWFRSGSAGGPSEPPRDSFFRWPWSQTVAHDEVDGGERVPSARRSDTAIRLPAPFAGMQPLTAGAGDRPGGPPAQGTPVPGLTGTPLGAVTPAAARVPTELPPDAAAGVAPIALQQPLDPILPDQDQQDYQMVVQLEPPGPQRLFRLESEVAFQERLRQEARERPTPERIDFPEEPVLAGGKVYGGRLWPQRRELAEPNYVCYRRLLFEEKNSERYGWDLGIASPIVSSAAFYWDVVTLPYHLGTAVCRKNECSADYCLPGDPVPYLLYPPELSVTGTIAEVAVIAGLAAIFP